MIRIFLILFSLLTIRVDAQTINFEIGATATSGNTSIGNIITDGLNKRGYKVDFKSLGNCALARKQFEDADGPFLTLWQNSYNSQKSPACNLEIKKENLISIVYEIPISMCAIGNKTFQDYIIQKSSHVVGVMAQSVPYYKLFDEIEKKYNIKHNILVYKNSAELTAAGKSKEVDFVLMSHDAAEQLGFKCIWTLGENTDVLRARDLWPDNPINSAGSFLWLMQKNLNNNQIEKLKKDIQDIYNEKEWQEVNRTKGYARGFNFNLNIIIKKIEKDREISIFE